MKYNRFMGEYDDNTIYQAGDVVNFDGASYYRKVPGKGISPIARKKPYTVWSRLNEALSTIFPLGGTGGGASLPTAAPYQQLVTDGSGATGWAERLAWKESGKTNTLPEMTVECADAGMNRVNANGEKLYEFWEEGELFSIQNLKPDTTYTVIWDGKEYVCPAILDVLYSDTNYEITLGNPANSTNAEEQTDTGEPFCIDAMVWGSGGDYYVLSTVEGEHTLEIYEHSETIHPISPEYLPAEKWDAELVYPDQGYFPDVGAIDGLTVSAGAYKNMMAKLVAGQIPKVVLKTAATPAWDGASVYVGQSVTPFAFDYDGDLESVYLFFMKPRNDIKLHSVRITVKSDDTCDSEIYVEVKTSAT